MKIVHKDKSKNYGIYKVGPGCHRIVKNLKDYSDEKEAIGDLVKLLDGEISEQDLTGSSYEQDMAAGVASNRINVIEAALEGIRDSLVDSLVLIGEDARQEVKKTIKKINDLVEGGKHEN